MPKLAFSLRILLGLALVLTVIAVGFNGRSAWLILLYGVVYALLFILGKPLAWSSYSSLKWWPLCKALLLTLVIQTLLTGLLYLIGRGLGGLFGHQSTALLQIIDIQTLFALLFACGIASLFLARLDQTGIDSVHGAKTTETFVKVSDTYVLAFDASPITIDNFYQGVFYGHLQHDASGQMIQNDVLPERAQPSVRLIAETEARLGVVLPPLLKQLYLKQNGGDVGNLWVPAVGAPSNQLDDWRGVFSHDYCYLAPLEYLNTLHDSYLYCMSEEEIAQDDSLEKHAKQYVMLCQRYMDTTFLDYSQSHDQPRVGVVDFDGIDKNNVWFDSFDAFFAALKRGEIVA